MKSTNPSEAIPLSALQHYAFCPRQCALIHNERIWSENVLTARGRALHERVDSGEPETRKGIHYARAVHVSSRKFGLSGIIDLLEVHVTSGKMKPVEYKNGRSKATNVDRIQLCAQALCLEEMHGMHVSEGALWYGRTRRREAVILDDSLRAQTLAVIEKTRALLASGKTPPPILARHCKACSLFDSCQPALFTKDRSPAYVRKLFADEVFGVN